MPKVPNINRIIDANINRAKEGLRVCEEVTRFILNSRLLTAEFKKARHGIDGALKNFSKYSDLVKSRESGLDVGRYIHKGEFSRKNLKDIFSANIQRVKESVRVLEEFSKLIDIKASLKFKNLRYDIYALEKEASRKLSALRNHR